MVVKIFNTFPREVNRKIVKNSEEMNKAINTLNTYQHIYTSIFSFEKIRTIESNNKMIEKVDYESAIIDKVFFDFDGENCLEIVKKMRKKLIEMDIKHTIFFSGNGFHLYIFCEINNNLKYKKDALFNAGKYFVEISDLTMGRSNRTENINFDVDASVIGDLARLTRFPNTYNLKWDRWCIPMFDVDLNKSLKEIKEEAKHQRTNVIYVEGEKLINLSQFDYPKDKVMKDGELINVEIPYSLPDNIPDEWGEEKLWACVKKMIVDRSGYQGWFYGVIWLRDKMGLNQKEAEAVMKKYLSKYKRSDGYKDDFDHIQKHDITIKTIYNDIERKYLYPHCETLWQLKWCPGKCPFYNKIYFNRQNGNTN